MYYLKKIYIFKQIQCLRFYKLFKFLISFILLINNNKIKKLI